MTLQGKSLSRGICAGQVCLYDKADGIFKKEISIEEAFALYKNKLTEAPSFSKDFQDAYLAILEDEILLEEIKKLSDTKSDKKEVIREAFESFAECIEKAQDETIAQRSKDIRLIANELTDLLKGGKEIPEKSVIAAREFSPTAFLANSEKIVGIVTKNCGENNHLAIMARMAQIPLVTDVDPDVFEDGETIMVDGETGLIKRNISSKELACVSKKKVTINPVLEYAKAKIKVRANISGLKGENLSKLNMFDGIGLLRPEAFYMSKKERPGVEELGEYLGNAILNAQGKTVRLRTPDFGGDKTTDYKLFDMTGGKRGLALSLTDESVLKDLYEVAFGFENVEILFPYVEDFNDLRRAKKIIEKLGYNFRIGSMIESKKGIENLDGILAESDFISVGTNDLTEDVLGISRTEIDGDLGTKDGERLTRAIDEIVRKCKAADKSVCICGELASNMKWVDKFIALGVDEISIRLWE